MRQCYLAGLRDKGGFFKTSGIPATLDFDSRAICSECAVTQDTIALRLDI